MIRCRLKCAGLERCDNVGEVPVGTVQWDGGGDGTSWSDPLNWKGDEIPVDDDDVLIRLLGSSTVVYDSSLGTTRLNTMDTCESLTISGGTLELVGDSWVRAELLISNGILTVSSNLTVWDTFTQSGGTLNGVGTVTIGDLFTWSGDTQSESGTTIASGGLSMSGTATRYLRGRVLTLNDATSWTGGQLRLYDGSTINNNEPMDTKTDADMAHFSNPVSTFNNNSSVTKSAGTDVTFIAADFINDDSIIVATGKLGFSKTFEQTALGTLELGIANGSFDSYAVTGSATLDGTLNIVLEGGYEPLLGETFEIMTFASRVGTFASVNGLSIVAGRKFDVVYSAGNVVLEVVTDP